MGLLSIQLADSIREPLNKSFMTSQRTKREKCDFLFSHKINGLQSSILAAPDPHGSGKCRFCIVTGARVVRSVGPPQPRCISTRACPASIASASPKAPTFGGYPWRSCNLLEQCRSNCRGAKPCPYAAGRSDLISPSLNNINRGLKSQGPAFVLIAYSSLLCLIGING